MGRKFEKFGLERKKWAVLAQKWHFWFFCHLLPFFLKYPAGNVMYLYTTEIGAFLFHPVDHIWDHIDHRSYKNWHLQVHKPRSGLYTNYKIYPPPVNIKWEKSVCFETLILQKKLLLTMLIGSMPLTEIRHINELTYL